MTRQELYNLISPDHALNYDSILPQDYCYNRMNDGIAFKDHVHLFEYLGRNRYRLLGDRYPYTGEIIHKPKRCPEVIVGKWKQGTLILQKEACGMAEFDVQSGFVKVISCLR